ncbi:MAG: phosphatase PAP2 family protein, partial [Thermoanaerobaculia bacterium]|nr:phosphatase PAP2 family protein [Thermoanaerobaculia bacterium]
GLKVMVPLLTDRSFDQILWEVDSWLFFGFSPNIFFVNLLDNSTLLRFIDFGYGYFFFFSVFVAIPLFLPLKDDRLRTSFFVANALLWSVGAWLYFAFPSLGPAYRFHSVWDAVREQFPVSTYWQKQLLDNYQMVLRIAQGEIDPRVNLVEGIGAFPSLHVGFQALFALYLGSLSRVASRVAWLLVALTVLGSIVTGWHYMIDSVAGLALAFGCWFLMERVVLPEPARVETEPDS